MLQQIRINGGVYDHSTTRVDFACVYPVSPTVKNYISEFNYSQKMNGANNVYGIQLSPLESTRGVYQAEFGFTIHKEGWDLFLSGWPAGYTDIRFDVSITFINPLSPLGISNIVIPTVRIVGADTSSSQGGKEIDVKVSTIVSGVIVENGKTMIPLDQDILVTT